MYKFKITIDKTKVSGSHTNFPFLFTQDCTDIPVGFWIHVTDSNGLDIRFFDTDGVTELKREVVFFDVSGHEVEAWVQIPFLSSAANKEIWCQYGGSTVANSTSMWTDINASGIFHFGNPSTNPGYDEKNSMGIMDATVIGASLFPSGKIGAAYTFVATNFIQITKQIHHGMGGLFTVCGWARATSPPPHIYGMIAATRNRTALFFGITDTNAYGIYNHIGWGNARSGPTGWGGVGSNQAFPSQQNLWKRVVTVYDGTDLKIYVDGIMMGFCPIAADSMPPCDLITDIGCNEATYSFIGEIDEVDFYTDAKSDDWIATEFNNQNDPAIFESAGSEINLSLMADFTGTPVSGNASLLVTFTDISTGSPTLWDWDFGDGSSHGVTQNPTHVYDTAGVYTVILSVNGGASTKTITNYITINLVANFSVDHTSGAVPLSVQFTDISTGGPDSWVWEFGDGNISYEHNPIHLYTSVGTYTVKLTIAKGSSTTYEEKPNCITVTSVPPTADFIADQTSGDYPLVVQFTDTSTCPHPIIGWAWDFGDSYTSTERNPIHTYNVAGTYTVTLTVENEYYDPGTEIKTNYISVSDLFLIVNFVGIQRQGASPLIVDFTNQTTLPPGHTSVTWLWDFGDGYTSTERDPTHVYLSGGSFTVTLKAFVEL